MSSEGARGVGARAHREVGCLVRVRASTAVFQGLLELVVM